MLFGFYRQNEEGRKEEVAATVLCYAVFVFFLRLIFHLFFFFLFTTQAPTLLFHQALIWDAPLSLSFSVSLLIIKKEWKGYRTAKSQRKKINKKMGTGEAERAVECRRHEDR